jgi:hypothetical protein
MVTVEALDSAASASVSRLGVGKKRRLIVATLVAVAVALLSALGWSEWRSTTGAAAGSAVPTMVSGVVLIEGGPMTVSGQTAGTRPLSHARLVVAGTTNAGARLLRHLNANTNGRFALRLPAGTYVVTALIIHNAPMGQQPNQKITVRSGHAVRVPITFAAS